MTLQETLIHAATEYDRKQVNKPLYNHYALALVMGRIQDMFEENDVTRDNVIGHLENNFNDRVLNNLRRAAETR